VATANHWNAFPADGIHRGRDSLARQARLLAAAAAGGDPFTLAWLAPPVLNRDTRVAVAADPASGRLTAQGWERHGPATAVARVAFPPPGDVRIQ
jgi:hypothetical protein